MIYLCWAKQLAYLINKKYETSVLIHTIIPNFFYQISNFRLE